MAKVVGYALEIVGVVVNAYYPGAGNYFIYAGAAILTGDAIEQTARPRARHAPPTTPA